MRGSLKSRLERGKVGVVREKVGARRQRRSAQRCGAGDSRGVVGRRLRAVEVHKSVRGRVSRATYDIRRRVQTRGVPRRAAWRRAPSVVLEEEQRREHGEDGCDASVHPPIVPTIGPAAKRLRATNLRFRCRQTRGRYRRHRKNGARSAFRVTMTRHRPYPRRMLHRLAILSALLLTACGATPPPATPDASGDAAPVDVAQDAAPDAPPPPDVAVDAAPDAPVDTAAPDVAPDAPPPPPDAAVDVAADAADVAPEATRDAAPPDTAPDATPCVERATRCVGTSINVVDHCIGGVWVRGTCPTAPPTGALFACTMDVCLACRRDASGTGCSTEPYCTEDADCYRRGLGRCSAGRCARRGPIRCTQNSDCDAWSTLTTGESCGENRGLGPIPVMTCATSSVLCNTDLMCPATYRCDTATGFCVVR